MLKRQTEKEREREEDRNGMGRAIYAYLPARKLIDGILHSRGGNKEREKERAPMVVNENVSRMAVLFVCP